MSSKKYEASFVLSAAELEQLPFDNGYEVAIVGRSNAGKSSTLNKITGQKQLARVSKTPGRTQLINVFQIDTKRRLIDLPGYGFAKVPLAAKLKWQKTVDAYIHTRESLKGLILVMDIRHPFRELDIQLIEYCEQRSLPVHVLLNKADKLSKSAALDTLRKCLGGLGALQNVTIQILSTTKGTGMDDLYRVLDRWYGWGNKSV